MRLASRLAVSLLAIAFFATHTDNCQAEDPIIVQRGRGAPVVDDAGKRLGTFAGIYKQCPRSSLQSLVGLRQVVLDIILDPGNAAGRAVAKQDLNKDRIAGIVREIVTPAGITLVEGERFGKDCFEVLQVEIRLQPVDDKGFLGSSSVRVLQPVRLRREPRPVVLATVFEGNRVGLTMATNSVVDQIQKTVRNQLEVFAGAYREANAQSPPIKEIAWPPVAEHDLTNCGLLEVWIPGFVNEAEANDPAQREHTAATLKALKEAKLTYDIVEGFAQQRLRSQNLAIRWPNSRRTSQSIAWVAASPVYKIPGIEDELYVGIECILCEEAELLRFPTTFVLADTYRTATFDHVPIATAVERIRTLLANEIDELARRLDTL